MRERAIRFRDTAPGSDDDLVKSWESCLSPGMTVGATSIRARLGMARPWRALALGTAIAAALGASGAVAAPARSSPVDRLCRATAATAPSPAALAIATAAVREHESFGGHVIGRDGVLVRFGAVEADVARDETAGRGVPWRQVIRYWQSLGALEDGPLQLRRVPRAVEDASAGGSGDLVPLADALARLRGPAMAEAERDALVQAALRAAAVDIPWSAAFVSHVVLSAGVPRSRFTAAIAHLDYVAEAARRSAEESESRPATSFYRACDPRRTALRPGDLLCLHRHEPGSLPTGSGYGDLIPALARGERPVWNLHCDVVVARDSRRATATVIGGNVLQSVAKRELRTDRRGALGRARSGPSCETGSRTSTLCRPEEAPWFVLLQAVDPSDP